MASDLNREKWLEGNTVHLCINCNSENELNSFFSKLSAGGKVTQPLADMPWGAKYGALTDKYGKHWVFNFQKVLNQCQPGSNLDICAYCKRKKNK